MLERRLREHAAKSITYAVTVLSLLCGRGSGSLKASVSALIIGGPLLIVAVSRTLFFVCFLDDQNFLNIVHLKAMWFLIVFQYLFCFLCYMPTYSTRAQTTQRRGENENVQNTPSLRVIDEQME